MIVAELKEMLEDFDEDMEVCIGMEQTYGSNWAYTICETDVHNVSNLDTGENEDYLVLSMGRQFGTVKYDECDD
ncbi:MAG: hypothetical protein J6Y86_03245, partial [Pseudobutyrivibrio sp.]|nr:hypothetical protein [Pseudobutyrivibrio sp.]